MVQDFDLIVASFQEQYGIRLSRDLKEMNGAEFTALLTSLSGDTPLGRIVSIRSETDKERIKEFSSSEMKIYTEWRKKTADNVAVEDRNKALESIKNAFIELAK